MTRITSLSRRKALKGTLALGAAASVPTGWAIAQAKPLKVGLMLPYSGTFAQLGENITHAIEMYIAEKGGKLGGREIQIIKLDDESKPELGPQNADRLIKRDGVDVLIGTVHSGVQMAIHKAVTESGTLCIVPNAGAGAVTRNLCTKNVFRNLVLKLAACLRHGPCARQTRRQESRVDHVGLRSRCRSRSRLQGRPRKSRWASCRQPHPQVP